MVGLDVHRAELAVPLLVLSKVELVNGEVEGRPLLMTYAPFAGADEALEPVYEPVVDGRRLTFGSSGYSATGGPCSTTADSEGLWTERPEGLVALDRRSQRAGSSSGSADLEVCLVGLAVVAPGRPPGRRRRSVGPRPAQPAIEPRRPRRGAT